MTADPRPLIAHVFHRFTMGGLENGVVNLVNGLPADRFRHAIVCVEDYTDFRDRIKQPDVEIHAMHRSEVGVRRMRFEMLRLFRSIRPAILHTRNLSALDALLHGRIAGIRRAVQGEHGRDVEDLHGDNRKLIWLRRLHRPLVSHYIAVSKDLEHYLRDRVGVRASCVTQIYNGVDTVRFAPSGPRMDDAMPPAFRGDGRILVGTVGRLQEVKNQVSLMRAFSALLSRTPALRSRLRLAIVGDGPLRADLAQAAGQLGIADVTWFPGATDRVPDALRSLDIFVLPSLAEGISNTILEAMASGCPVVVTAVGGNVELVEDGEYGCHYPSGDAEALTGILQAYVDNPVLRQRHGRAARSAAVARFSLDAMMRNYAQVYDRLLDRT